MMTYNPKKRHGGSGKFFDGKGKSPENDVIDLLCGAGMEKSEWLRETEKYLKSLQNDDGSFGTSRVYKNHSNVMTTCYAVLSLKAIGCEDAKVFEKAKEYILSLRNEDDGSFGWANSSSKGSVDRLFGAITALRAIGYTDGRVLTECREYIESIENLDGGFGSMKGGISDIENTTQALLTLKAAGAQKKDMPASKKYILSLKNGDGGFSFSEFASGSNVIRTSYAILAMHALGSPAPEDTKDYIYRLEGPDGFGWNAEYDPNNAFQLYHAVLGLFAAGERDLPIEYAEYAKKLKNADGGFGWSASDRKSNVKNTFHAIMAIKAVDISRKAKKK